MGLLARGLEIEGIATSLISWKAGIIRATRPPRALITETERGATLGAPHDTETQFNILKAALGLLEKDAPTEPVIFDNYQ